MNCFSRTARAVIALGVLTAGPALAQKPPPAAPAPTPAPPAAPPAPFAKAAAAAPAPAPAAAAPDGPASVAPAAPAMGPDGAPVASGAPVAKTASPPGRIACLVGDHPREYSDSARTAAGLVCDAIREQGIDVGGAAYEPNGATSAYVVNLDQLGSTFFLRVSYEEPIGVSKKTRRVSLSEIAEAEVAAPRVARAMTDANSVDETANYDNIVGSEHRFKEKKTGELVIGLGITALSMPVAGSYMGPTLNIFGWYETRDWGIGIQGHIGDAETERGKTATYAALSVGARYYFSDQNTTPLVGGGLAISSIYEHAADAYYSVQGGGTAAYLEAGAEFFRLHKTHLILTLRVDAPFYKESSRNQYYSSYSSGTATTTPQTPANRYEIPILLNVGVGF